MKNSFIAPDGTRWLNDKVHHDDETLFSDISSEPAFDGSKKFGFEVATNSAKLSNEMSVRKEL